MVVQNRFQDSDDDDLDVEELGVNHEEERAVHVVAPTLSNPDYSDYHVDGQLRTATEEVNNLTDNVDIDPLQILHNGTGCTSTGRLIEAYGQQLITQALSVRYMCED
jgi:hypothetical protein